MSTRLKRPSIIKQLGYTALLGGFLAYMGFSVVSGQYGIESQEELENQIIELKIENSNLTSEVENYKSKISLLDSKNLDPDILSERARGLLSMAKENDRIILFPTNDN